MYSNIKMALFTTLSLLLLPLQSCEAFGIDLGPFSFNVRGGNYGDPICNAIRDTHLIKIGVVIDQEKEQAEEKLSQLLVEPYTVGYNKKGEIVLLAYVVKDIKLATNKPSDKETSERAEVGIGQANIGSLRVTLKESHTMKAFKIENIRGISVLNDTNFMVKDKVDKGNISENNRVVDIICSQQVGE